MAGQARYRAGTAAARRRFVDCLADHGERPALVDAGGRMVSYAALARRVAAFAARLGRARRLVVVEAALDRATVVAYLGAMAGGHPVLLCPPGDLAGVLAARYGAGWLVTAAGRLLRRNGHVALHPDLALLLSTSGSTGSPRLVRLSTGNVESNARAIAQALALGPTDRGAVTLPLHYSYGLSILNSHLAVGASLYLCSRPITDPRFLDGLAAAACTNLSGVPLSYALFERIGLRTRAWPALRFMTVAGGPLEPDLIRTYGAFFEDRGGRFYAMYGQTEATARIAVVPPDRVMSEAGTVGQPLAGGRLALIDEQGGEITGPGRIGELVYHGPNVMMGYAEGPGDLALGATVEHLSTGDLAERDPSGAYRIRGRKSRFSKLAGLRIDHDQVERRLAAAGVEAAVTGNDKALIVAVSGPPPAARQQALVQHATGLAAAQLRLVAVDRLPRLGSGKIDYPAVGRLADAPPAADPPGIGIAAAFARAFAPRPTGPADSFVTLGGDSVIHLGLALDLEQRLGRLPAGWERRSIAELAAGAVNPDPERRRLVDSAVLTRVGAILLVALHHATQWPIPGGAAILMLLVGHSLGRFQFNALVAGRLSQVARPVLRNIALYYLVLVALMAAQQRLDWPSLLLVGNTGWGDQGRVDTIFVIFWFVEAYAQLLLLVLALFALPGLRRWVQSRPLAAGLVALGVGLGLRLGSPLVVDYGRLAPMATPMVLYMAAFGWCLAFADSRRCRLLMLGLAMVIFPAIPLLEGAQWLGLWIKPAILLAAVALLLGTTAVALPAGVARAVMRLAAASYVIYLVHGLPALVVLPVIPDWPPAARILVALGGGVAFGLLCHGALRRVSARCRDRRQATPRMGDATG